MYCTCTKDHPIRERIICHNDHVIKYPACNYCNGRTGKVTILCKINVKRKEDAKDRD
jgi:hypothetical protein